jgi:hypothetical protein
VADLGGRHKKIGRYEHRRRHQKTSTGVKNFCVADKASTGVKNNIEWVHLYLLKGVKGDTGEDLKNFYWG